MVNTFWDFTVKKKVGLKILSALWLQLYKTSDIMIGGNRGKSTKTTENVEW